LNWSPTCRLQNIGDNTRAIIQDLIGNRLQNDGYRELLLRVISEQWVEYLTSVEALRVSIGMEAYAQRDPLVQYKGRATEMFAQLLVDIRMGAIGRVFTYHPRTGVATTNAVEREKVVEGQQAALLPRPSRSGQPARPRAFVQAAKSRPAADQRNSARAPQPSPGRWSNGSAGRRQEET